MTIQKRAGESKKRDNRREEEQSISAEKRNEKNSQE